MGEKRATHATASGSHLPCVARASSRRMQIPQKPGNKSGPLCLGSAYHLGLSCNPAATAKRLAVAKNQPGGTFRREPCAALNPAPGAGASNLNHHKGSPNCQSLRLCRRITIPISSPARRRLNQKDAAAKHCARFFAMLIALAAADTAMRQTLARTAISEMSRPGRIGPMARTSA